MEAEIAGVKFKGAGRLAIAFTALTTLAGGGWSVFTLYQEFLDLREVTSAYVAPDLTYLEKQIVELDGTSEALQGVVREQVNSMKEQLGILQTSVYDLKLELKQDLTRVSDRVDTQLAKQTNILDQQDTRNRSNVQTVRGIITAFEGRMDNRITKLNESLDTLEADLDARITYALNNPLSN